MCYCPLFKLNNFGERLNHRIFRGPGKSPSSPIIPASLPSAKAIMTLSILNNLTSLLENLQVVLHNKYTVFLSNFDFFEICLYID